MSDSAAPGPAARREPSMPESQVLWQLERAAPLHILPAAGRSTAPATGCIIHLERGRGRHLEGMTPGAAQSLVDRRQLRRGQLLELSGNIVQLCAQRGDVIELVARRRTIPGDDGAIKLIGVLAQPLLAGDGTAFSGRNDALAQPIELSVEIREPPLQRISRLPALARRGALLAEAGDASEQCRLVVEERVHLHCRVVLRLPGG